ncbi:hypothetical protein AOLI_G00113830 [Acnodon oligacanthus]
MEKQKDCSLTIELQCFYKSSVFHLIGGSGCHSSSYTARYVLANQRARLDQKRGRASSSKAARRHLRGSLGSLVVVFSLCC